MPFGAIIGPERYLNDTEEEQLVKFLVGAAKIGFPRPKKQVVTIVQASLAKKRGCSVDDIHVTSGWLASFKKRHPMLTLRSGSKLSYRRLLASSPETINAYFDILEEAMQKTSFRIPQCSFITMTKPVSRWSISHVNLLVCVVNVIFLQLQVMTKPKLRFFQHVVHHVIFYHQ